MAAPGVTDPHRQASVVAQHAAVIYNPIKVDLKKLRASVNAAAQSAGWADTLWFPTSEKDAGQQATRRAIRQGIAMVIAAGGDGTVRAVAETLRDSEIPLAIVPSGTGNLLARNLQLPLGSIDDAAAIAFGGEDRAIDLGVASVTGVTGDTDDHVFLVMAGLGLDAEMIAATRPDLKKQVGWLAYIDAGMRVIPKAVPFRIRYSVAGRADRSAHISTILIANCGTLPGNLQFLPEAQVDDGILDIAMLQPKGLFGWLKIWRRVSWENGVLRRSKTGRKLIEATEENNERTMMTLQSADIRITVDNPQPFEIDGDEFGSVRALFVRADPRALIVKVPAASS
ncbi:diacylglycerol kinase family protein [Leifsonia sp. YAF41]|uniref:diacylglycerol/lipid kinase family protein n=1 Tax=Leifsonia sp. YAF41 TaxID=3233086 RepID=UPI003F98530E